MLAEYEVGGKKKKGHALMASRGMQARYMYEYCTASEMWVPQQIDAAAQQDSGLDAPRCETKQQASNTTAP
jgi:hypothetical protein